MHPPALRLSIRELLLIIFGLAFALVAQAWSSRTLLAYGYGELEAHYRAYLIVPPILLIVLAPVLIKHRNFLMQLFSPSRLSVRLVLTAMAFGLLARIAWWSQLIVRVSFGIAANDVPQAITGPVLSWACPPMPSLALGLLVMAVLVPVIEETVHRGLLQSAFVQKGALTAILFSSLVFSLFHPPSSHGFVFLAGIVFGIQFWVTGSLWVTMIGHATYNGLIQFDWRCLQGQWNPPPESLPQVLPAAISLTTLLGASVLIVGLLCYQRAGARAAPAASVSPARSRRAR